MKTALVVWTLLSAGSLCAQSTTRPASTIASGVLYGTVLTENTERPLLGAEIAIRSLRLLVTSDSAGNFRMPGVRRGAYEVEVRLNGFETVRTTFDFSDGEKIAVDFMMPERVIQYAPRAARERDGIDVDIRRLSMEERRQQRAGRYIAAEDVAAAGEITTAEFIRRKIPELHANSLRNNGRALASKQQDVRVELAEADRKSSARADCYVRVLLNGTLVYQSVGAMPLFDVNSIPVSMIQSADYFTAAETPAESRTDGARCGTLQIWTRGR